MVEIKPFLINRRFTITGCESASNMQKEQTQFENFINLKLVPFVNEMAQKIASLEQEIVDLKASKKE